MGLYSDRFNLWCVWRREVWYERSYLQVCPSLSVHDYSVVNAFQGGINAVQQIILYGFFLNKLKLNMITIVMIGGIIDRMLPSRRSLSSHWCRHLHSCSKCCYRLFGRVLTVCWLRIHFSLRFFDCLCIFLEERLILFRQRVVLRTKVRHCSMCFLAVQLVRPVAVRSWDSSTTSSPNCPST